MENPFYEMPRPRELKMLSKAKWPQKYIHFGQQKVTVKAPKFKWCIEFSLPFSTPFHRIALKHVATGWVYTRFLFRG